MPNKMSLRRVPLMRTVAVAAALAAVPFAHAAGDLSRLKDLLATTPENGWVKVSTGQLSSAFPTGSFATGVGDPRSIVGAWSSVAWDSASSTLLLWGGGHANYNGNEMYKWSASTGTWSLGSLPSKVGPSNYIVDNAAPQSAHTYDNNVYLPVNNMFLTLGGAAYNSGGNFQTNINGVVSRAGPWVWDPTKADGTKVGGTDGSGYNPSSLGGNMWLNRYSMIVGQQGPSYVQGSTAYVTENGKDVVYISSDSQSSGFPGLYRYELGDIRNGGTDLYQKVGITSNSVIYQGAATIDTGNNYYVRTALGYAPHVADLAVWNLASNNASLPTQNRDFAVDLVLADGTDFSMSQQYGIDYDAVNGTLVLWDGNAGGKVWITKAEFDAGGALKRTWTVKPIDSTTLAQPTGNFASGVLGKWHYAQELGAFIALDMYNRVSEDAPVWLYKTSSVAAVPELPVSVMLLPGLGLLALARRRRNTGR